MSKKEYYVDLDPDDGYGIYYDVDPRSCGPWEHVRVVPFNFPDREDAEVFCRLMNFGLRLKE